MPVFEKQGQHLLMIALLLAGVAWATRIPGVLEGSHRGIPTSKWFWWSIAVPIVHQTWVWLCWRLELHHKTLSNSLGDWGFRIYAIGFATASFFRFYTIVGLGLANRGTLDISQTLLNEISEARVCLLDPTTRGAYDARLEDQVAVPQDAAPEVAVPQDAAPEVAVPEVAVTQVAQASVKGSKPPVRRAAVYHRNDARPLRRNCRQTTSHPHRERRK